MAGYVRQDISNQIAAGEVIQADPLDAEFDALLSAFSAASGHRHNGSAGEGAPITVIGPSQNVGISANSVTPSVDNLVDLGSSTSEFKDLWIDGTANIDLLAADAGTVGGAAITTVSNTQTVTNKTINLTNNTLVATSAQLAAAVTDETGTGALVFAVSPALAGTPTAPTAVADTNTTQVATTAHVFAERSNTASLTNKTIDLTNNTLVTTSAQLAAAVTDETGSGPLVFSVSPALTGTPTAPTAAAGTNTTQIATTAHVFAERSNAATLTNKTLSSPTISGGSITGITDLAVADGGTGASTAPNARANLGLAIGTDVQAYDAGLQSISGLTTSANQLLYTTAADTYATTSFTAFGRNLVDDVDAAAGRATLGLGTMSTQNSNAVAITGGGITGTTVSGLPSALAVADGGTGATTVGGAQTALGIQPVNAQLTTLSSYNSNGLFTQTAAGTYTGRTITGVANQISVSNGDGVSGNPSIGLPSGVQLTRAVLNEGYTEQVFTLTGTTPAISSTNGSIQTWTLTGNSVPTSGLTSGQSVLLMIDDGSSFAIDWSSIAVVWKSEGGLAPVLNTTGFTAILLWCVSTTVYGARVGNN